MSTWETLQSEDGGYHREKKTVSVRLGLQRHLLCRADPLQVLSLRSHLMTGHKHFSCGYLRVLRSMTAENNDGRWPLSLQHFFFTVKLCGFTFSLGHPAFWTPARRPEEEPWKNHKGKGGKTLLVYRLFVTKMTGGKTGDVGNFFRLTMHDDVACALDTFDNCPCFAVAAPGHNLPVSSAPLKKPKTKPKTSTKAKFQTAAHDNTQTIPALALLQASWPLHDFYLCRENTLTSSASARKQVKSAC